MKFFLKPFLYYRASFTGFTKPVWWLALASLINRAGAMVLPFLSIYLTSSLGFSKEEVGIVMIFYGLGAFAGAWLGGETSSKYGAYKSMIASLVLGGICFYALGQLTNFWSICIGMFVTSMVSDVFRPAVFVALAQYAKPENRTRAVTLLRLAINLGFSLGPGIGGLIIVAQGYQALFWIDGLTCVVAGLLIMAVLHPTNNKQDEVEQEKQSGSFWPILKDADFLLLLIGLLLFGIVFVQYFSAIPVYYKELRFLEEDQVGYLMSLNGGLIFLFEMPLIYALDKPQFSKYKIIIAGCFMLALSFALLLLGWAGWMVIGMALATFAEMLCFPFSNSIAMVKGAKNVSRYMALYTMTFSVAHIIGHFFGMKFSDVFGFTSLFVVLIVLSIMSALLFYLSERGEKRKRMG